MDRCTLSFTAPQVCDWVGIEYSKLDYWVRKGIVTPEIAIAEGRGSRRQYSFRNLIALKVAVRLREEGLSSEKLKNVLYYLYDLHDEIMLRFEFLCEDLVLMTDGRETFQLPLSFDTFRDTLTNKEFFWLIPLGTYIRELDERLICEESKKVRVG